jgi:hypothetical protein
MTAVRCRVLRTPSLGMGWSMMTLSNRM